jgi:hypothetical protein
MQNSSPGYYQVKAGNPLTTINTHAAPIVAFQNSCGFNGSHESDVVPNLAAEV